MHTMVSIPLRRALAPACLLLAVTAGCGSDDTGLTKAEYQKAANAVCAVAEPKLAGVFEELFPKLDTATVEERQTAADELLAIVTKELDDLDALTPPEDMTEDVDAMMAAARKAEDVVRSQGADFWLDDTDPFADANAQAAALGLDACAGDSSE